MDRFTLKSIRLENFKKHKDLTIEFSETLTVIRGANYTGKSTGLRGAWFVMGGASFAGGSKTIPRKTSNEPGRRSRDEKTRVTLNFIANGERRVAQRTLTAATVWDIEGNILATGQTQVTAWFENLLGMDIRRAQLLSYSDEGEAAGLLALGAPALNRMMEQLAEADYVERLIKRCTARVTAARAVLESLGELPALDPVKAQRAEQVIVQQVASQTMTNSKAQAERLFGEQREKESALALLDAENAAIRSRMLQINQLDGQIQLLESTVSQIREEVAGKTEKKLASAIAAAKKKADKAQETLNSISVNNMRAKLLKETIAGERKWLDSCNWELAFKAHDAPLKVCEAEFQAKDKEYRTTLDLTARLKDQLDAVITDIKGAVCVACGRAFDATHLEKAKAKQARLQADFDQQTRVSTQAMDARALAQRARDAHRDAMPPENWRALVAEHTQALRIGSEALSAIPESTPEIEAQAAQDVHAARTALSDAEKAAALYDGAQQRLRRAEDDLAGKVVQRKSIHIGIEVPTAGMQDEIDKLKLSIQQLKQDYLVNKERAEAAKLRINTLEVQIKQIEDLYVKRDSNESIISRFGGLGKWLRDNKDAFLRDLWDATLAGASEFAAACTGGDITQVLRSDDGEFSYIEHGIEYPVDGSASGAQKAVMGIGLRLSLPAVLPQGVSFSILDEPSAAMTNELAQNLGGALRMLDRQIIVITHRDGEEYAADNVVVLE